MARKDIIIMSQEELKRLHVIKKVLERSISQVEASGLIGLSGRQVRRLVKEVRLNGEGGIIHKSRGKASNRSIPAELRDKVIGLYKSKYFGFGPTLAQEKILSIDKIRLSDETLRKWLISEELPYRKRKKRAHRQWRERKRYFGIMIQVDGSHHDWFEGRGRQCVFIGYIDDATGTIFGRFYSYEGTIPAMDSFKRYIKRYGIPLSIYVDKHSTYKSLAEPSIEEQLNDSKPLSEFGRALKELGVELIHAHSPQAKGRIERLFGTLQDRLVKEMRLKGIKSIEEANNFLESYLPEYNKKFAIKPGKKGDMHRSVPRGIDIDKILCIRTKRALRNDFTAAHNKRLYQIEDNIRAEHVVVEERIDGSMFITYKGKNLRFKEIAVRPEKKRQDEEIYKFTSRKIYTPPVDHPWRKFYIKPSAVRSKNKDKTFRKDTELLAVKI